MVKNPAEQFLPDVVEEFVNTVAVMLSGVVQAFAEEAKGIRAMLDAPVDAIPWEALGPELGQAQKKMVAAEKYLNPLLLGIKAGEDQGGRGQDAAHPRDLFSIMLPGMAIMFLLFIVQTLMRDIISEREDGKLRRMMTTPLRPLRARRGPLRRRLGHGHGCAPGHGRPRHPDLPGLLGEFRVFSAARRGRRPSGPPPSSALINALVKNRNQAGALGAPIILAFSLFGGSMMNPEAMPKAFRTVGILTPNRWFIDGAKLVREGDSRSCRSLVLVASGLVLAALAVPALRRKTSV